ncbi:hypothetical protein Tco_1173606 [Tanacetum coccineum]
MKIIKYKYRLKQSPGLRLQFNKTSDLKLKAFSNADWAKCPKTSRPVTGYCVFLGKSSVFWKSKKQSTISRSSAEAEYRSMASTTRRIIWLGNLLHSLGLKNFHPVTLLYDSNSAIQIAANPVFHEKTKHFENLGLKDMFAAESVDKGQKKGFTKAKILEVFNSNSGGRMSKIFVAAIEGELVVRNSLLHDDITELP